MVSKTMLGVTSRLLFTRLLFNFVILVLLHAGTGKKQLNLVGFLPMGGSVWPGGIGCLPAIEMGIRHVNARNDILSDYELNYIWEDTKCDAGIAVNKMYLMLYEEPTKIMIIGAGCSVESEATAQASPLWNLTQVSWGSGSPLLSDRTRFPRFFRLVPPDTRLNLAIIELLKYFEWTKIATINEARDYFSSVTDDLVNRLTAMNITILSQEIFSKDPQSRVENLKRRDARIIISSSYVNTAKLILCSAYKVGLYGPKIVWVFPSWYGKYWWRSNIQNVPCTVEQMDKAAEGLFQAGRFYWYPDETMRGISNLTVPEFKDLVKQEESYTEESEKFSFAGPTCYDVTWAVGQILQCADEKLREINHTKTLDQFTYKDADINEIITACAYKVNLFGLSGALQFGDDGDPIMSIKLERLQEGTMDWIGTYTPFIQPAKIRWEGSEIKWFDSKPPKDSTMILLMEVKVNPTVLNTVYSLSGLGILLTLGLLVFNITARKNRIVKMSSPLINNILLMGCAVIYLTVHFNTEDKNYKKAMCKARTICFSLGFTVAFSALFAKTWRVYKIFSNTKYRKIKIKDWHLLLHVACLTAAVGFVLLIREVVDPQTSTMQVLTKDIYLSDNDAEIHPYICVCVSEYSSYFNWTIYIVEGVLLTFGAFLAWETRNVKIEAMNDSHLIGICLYNVIILSGLGLTLSLVLDTQVTLIYGITSGFIIMGTTSTQLILFGPKIIAIRHSRQVAGPVTGNKSMPSRQGSNAVASSNNSSHQDPNGSSFHRSKDFQRNATEVTALQSIDGNDMPL